MDTVCCDDVTPAAENSIVAAVAAVPIRDSPLWVMQVPALDAAADTVPDQRIVPAPVAPSRTCSWTGVWAVEPTDRQAMNPVMTWRTEPAPAALEAVAFVAVDGTLFTFQVA